MPAKNKIADAVWDEQTDLYEIGLKHACEIAEELGVSPQTVSRELKRRGAIKGSRVNQSVEDLVALLDRKKKRAALVELSESRSRRKIAEANTRVVGGMLAALIRADEQGDLSSVAPLVVSIGKAFGGKRLKRR